MDKQQQIRLHQQKWKRWNQERRKDQIKKRVNYQDNLQNYAISIAEKLSDPASHSSQQKDLISKQITNQIESNVCGICLELMVPPHNPIILFPCGHNLCKFCLYTDAHIEKPVHKLSIQKCPLCRIPIKSHALNRNLMTLICTYTDNKHLLQKQLQKQKQLQNINQTDQNIDKLRVRCKILQKQKQLLKKQLNQYRKQVGILDEVVGTLKSEKKKNERQIQMLEQEGRLIRKHLQIKQEQSDNLRKKAKETQSKFQMIDKALAPLTMQKQKLQLLEVAKIMQRASLQ